MMLPDVKLYGVINSLLTNTKVFLGPLHVCFADFCISSVERCNYTTTVLAAYTSARRSDNKYVFGSEKLRCLGIKWGTLQRTNATTNSFCQ
jgi:hypothetical protein